MGNEAHERDQLLDEMTQALQEAIEIQNRYSETLTKLEQENTLLGKVIIRNKLSGQVQEERKKLEREEAEKNKNDEELDFDENLGFVEELLAAIHNGESEMESQDKDKDTTKQCKDPFSSPCRISLDKRIEHAKKQL